MYTKSIDERELMTSRFGGKLVNATHTQYTTA